jgi:hypothetical protein
MSSTHDLRKQPSLIFTFAIFLSLFNWPHERRCGTPNEAVEKVPGTADKVNRGVREPFLEGRSWCVRDSERSNFPLKSVIF